MTQIKTAADRLRGPARISWRGLWWPGPTIRRDRYGHKTRCAWCGRWKLLSGRWGAVEGVERDRYTSDGICPECSDRVKREVCG